MTSAVGPDSSEKTIVRHHLDSLLLDPENPRITVRKDASQEDILRYLLRRETLEELAPSLAKRYFTEEPIVVVPNDEEKGTFIVVEGNRRVATLKLLLRPAIRQALEVTDFPEVTDQAARQKLEQVPTIEYATRDEVLPYLGFRHITGIRRWDPYARARYVAGLVERGIPFAHIESEIGDTARTIKRLYQSFVVYRQISELGIQSDALDSFSLIEVMLGQQKIKTFLGVPKGLPIGPVKEVIPPERHKQLQEVVSYIFGDRSRRQQPVITESRQISKMLAPVLADPDALTVLQKTRDLVAANEAIGGEKEALLRRLAGLRRSASIAAKLVRDYQDDADVLRARQRLRNAVEPLIVGVEE